jgi:hypothetical protein
MSQSEKTSPAFTLYVPARVMGTILTFIRVNFPCLFLSFQLLPTKHLGALVFLFFFTTGFLTDNITNYLCVKSRTYNSVFYGSNQSLPGLSIVKIETHALSPYKGSNWIHASY